MDKQLLKALENVAFALEDMTEALKNREKKGGGSATGAALTKGDFGDQLKVISVEIKSIKKDTQEILRQQQTILSMQKKKSSDKKSGLFEETGGDKKKESSLKKGVATIILIAIAVLAIGMAFKLVGKIDFLSVIGLGLAILAISFAFEKVAKLKLSIKEVLIASLALVLMAVAITMSSWILKLITPIGFAQMITAILIATMFAVMSAKLENVFIAVAVFQKLRVKKAALVLALVSIAAAITASSWILLLVTPIGFLQALTAILIAGVFAVIAFNFEKIAIGVAAFDRLNVKKSALILTLVGIATAITLSSWIMTLIIPMSFGKAITAILISVIFLVISLNFEKIALGIAAFDRMKIKKSTLLLTLVGISTAITLSSWILALIIPTTISKFLTALGIALLFALMSYVMPELAGGLYIIDKVLGKKGVFLFPLVFVAISAAIMISSHVLNMSADIPLGKILQIAVFGVALAIIVLAMLPSVLLVGLAAASGVGGAAIGLGVLMIPLIAAAIMVSSHILNAGTYSKYPSWKWSLSVGLSMTIFGAAVIALGVIALTGIGIAAVAAGMLLVPLVALSIVLVDKIIRKGKYDKYPSLKWILSVGTTMTGFAIAIVGLGAIALTGIGLVAVVAGILIIPMIAKTIVKVDGIIRKGKYDKYPGLKWILSVGTVMTAFGAAVVTLGVLAITGFGLGAVALVAGSLAVLLIAGTIVATDKIISKGKYDKYPGLKWILSVGAVMTGFGAAVVTLGILAITGFGLGAVAIIAGSGAVILIAATILATDKIIGKGKYDKYPGARWILSIGSLLAIFGTAVVTLGILAITGFGLGALAIVVGTKMVPKIANTIVAVDNILSKGKYNKGPSWEWASSVGSLMLVFGGAILGVGILIVASLGLGMVAIKAGSSAVKLIAQSIVDVAGIFAKSGAVWKQGPTKRWAEGVSIALGAFAPIYKMLMTGGIMSIFAGSGPSPKKFADAIRTISQGIVDAANFFGAPGMTAVYKGGPSKKWAEGVGLAIGAFAPVYKILASEKGLFGSGVSINKFKKAIITISKGIVEAAGIFEKNKATFGKGNYPSAKWGQGVGAAIRAFAPVFKSLSEDTGWFSSGDDVIKGMVNGIKSIAGAIVAVGLKFSNKTIDWKSYPTKNWSWALKLAVGSFVRVSQSIAELDLSILNNPIIVANKMSNIAKIFAKNKKFFDTKFDQNWVKRIRKSLLDFNSLVRELQKSKGGGILGSLADAAKNLTGNDPITQMARQMITLSKGYDALANSLIKLSFAMKMLNLKSFSQLAMLTNAIQGGKQIDVGESSGKKFKKTDGEMAQVSGGKKDGGGGPSLKANLQEKNNIWYLSEQVEKTNKILKIIARSTATIDEFITLQTDGKIKQAPPLDKM
jgi:hypothetical protein